VWSNGKIHHKKVLELDDDDKLLVPKKLDLKEEDRAEIDLLKAFLSSDTVSGDVMVRGVRKVVEKIVKELGGLKSTAEQVKISEKTFTNYVYRDRIPLPILHSLLGLSHRDWTAIPRECQLSVKRDHTVIPRIIKLDSRFMRLIGYYLAEGYARSIEKEFYQVSMASWEKEMLDDMANCIRDVFGFLPGRKGGVLVISNRLIYHLFVEVLGTGKGAKEKRIPSLLRNLPRWKIKELLSAYFSGDGSVERDKLVVSCSSVSEKLLQDIGLQLLRFGIFYRLKSERKAAGGAAKQFYERKGRSEDKLPVFDIHYLFIRSRYARKFGEAIGFIEKQKNVALRAAFAKERAPRISSFGDAVLDEIKKIETINPCFEFLYDIEVEEHHNFLVNDFVLSANCDGDEDCVMLLMDGLLNFSKSYLPDKRGGKMDAPLVLTTHIDPNEIDKEAHNIDVTAQYPLEFYHATLTYTNPKEIIPYIDSVHNRLGTPQQYEEMMFTHHTDNIAAGPKNSAYKTLESMVDKMNAQLLLATKIRAVDDWDVAERVINSHFLPDLIGNLHAFTKQRVRCVKCGAKYRRPPLQNSCPRCGGRIVLTVHEGSVKKYLDVSLRVAEQYNVKPYTKQRIELLKKEIKSLFENDKSKQKGLADFM
jgi:DNA polymerase II large subunit